MSDQYTNNYEQPAQQVNDSDDKQDVQVVINMLRLQPVYSAGKSVEQIATRFSSNTIELQSDIDWYTEQRVDSDLGTVIANIDQAASDLTAWNQLRDGRIWHELYRESCLVVNNGVLYYQSHDGTLFFVVPQHLQLKIMIGYHDSPFYGHRGFSKTYEAIKSKYFWIFMYGTIKNYCANCDIYQKLKPPNISTRIPMCPVEASRPWHIIGIDMVGPLVTTPNRNR